MKQITWWVTLSVLLYAKAYSYEASERLVEVRPILGIDTAKERGKGTIIAILDGDFYLDHSDFKGKAVRYETFSTPPDRTAHKMHGTGVASVSAGNGIHRGIAPEADLVLLRCGGKDPLGLNLGAVDAALQWLIDHHGECPVDVLSMSFNIRGDNRAGKSEGRWTKQFAKLRELGVVLVASVGNDGADGQLGYPAADPNVIAVGALDETTLDVADFSNRHPDAVYLPASYTNAAGPYGPCSTSGHSGTSQAAPAYAGLVAIARSSGQAIEHRRINGIQVPRIRTTAAFEYDIKRPRARFGRRIRVSLKAQGVEFPVEIRAGRMRWVIPSPRGKDELAEWKYNQRSGRLRFMLRTPYATIFRGDKVQLLDW